MWEHLDILFFLRKTFTLEKGCISESHPGLTISGELLLVIPDLGSLHKTWFRQQRDGFCISPQFLQTAGGQHPVQARFLSLIRTTQWWVCGLVLWPFGMEGFGKGARAPKDLDHYIEVCSLLVLGALHVCCGTWGLSSASTKAAGETLLSVPHLSGGRRALHKQGQIWWGNAVVSGALVPWKSCQRPA